MIPRNILSMLSLSSHQSGPWWGTEGLDGETGDCLKSRITNGDNIGHWVPLSIQSECRERKVYHTRV